MKKFFFILLVFIFICVVFFFKFDDLLKNYFITNASKSIKKEIQIENVITNFLKGTIQITNLMIFNDVKEKNLVEVKSIKLKIDLSTLFDETIKIKKISTEGLQLNYQASIVKGKIIDNFDLINQFSSQAKIEKKKINLNKATNKLSSLDNKHQKQSQDKKKNKDRNFVIDYLEIPKILINAEFKEVNFFKRIEVDRMIFQNVGNTKGSNHFKDVFAMIATNIALKLNNEIIINSLKQKFDNKIKTLLKKDKIKKKLDSIIGSPEKSKKLLKKLDKFFK